MPAPVYKGLSFSLNRRLSNEIEFSGSYTLSKAIDDPSDFNEQPENPYLLQAERALSANDQRHRLVFSGTFDLPFGDEEEGKKSSGAIAKLFGNIEAAPIVTIGSGRARRCPDWIRCESQRCISEFFSPSRFPAKLTADRHPGATGFACIEILQSPGAWQAGFGRRDV